MINKTLELKKLLEKVVNFSVLTALFVSLKVPYGQDRGFGG